MEAVPEKARQLKITTIRVASFSKRVGLLFLANKGLLLAGAVAYNTLLSVVPMLAILMAVATSFFDQSQLLDIISAELDLIAPGRGGEVAAEIASFLQHRDLVGWVGFFVLLFFGSIAFRILEDAMALIFSRTPTPAKRHFLVSALLPYAYIAVLGLSLLVITGLSVLLESIARNVSWLQGEAIVSVLLYIAGLVGQVLLFTSIYRVLPVAKVQLHRAFVGAVVATVLWEGTRQFLSWYFDNLSLVNVVYGSLATVIIVLLSMEIAAIIVLLGAQVIAELERSAAAGVPWYVVPEEEPETKVTVSGVWRTNVKHALDRLSERELPALDASILLPSRVQRDAAAAAAELEGDEEVGDTEVDLEAPPTSASGH